MSTDTAALVRPGTQVQASFLAALAEFRAEGRYSDLDPVGLAEPDTFATYVATLLAKADPDLRRPDGIVPETVLWWISGAQYLGRISIRHQLTDTLRLHVGHIGYDVRPSARRQGHATAMLRAALPIANRLGIDPVLVICDANNIASRKVIEANGGQPATPDGGDILRYWAATTSTKTSMTR